MFFSFDLLIQKLSITVNSPPSTLFTPKPFPWLSIPNLVDSRASGVYTTASINKS